MMLHVVKPVVLIRRRVLRQMRDAHGIGGAATASHHSYAEAIVSFQNSCQSPLSMDALFDALERPSAIHMLQDLRTRQVALTDTSRAQLLVNHALDLDAPWEEREGGEREGEGGDGFRELQDFFLKLLPRRHGPTPELVKQYLRLAKSYGHAEAASTISELAKSGSIGCSFKDVLHDILSLCADVECSEDGAHSPWVIANEVLAHAAATRCMIDHRTVGLYLRAVAQSKRADALQEAMTAVVEYPMVGRMLRKSHHFYLSALESSVLLEERDSFDMAKDIFEEMDINGVQPTLAHYTILLRLCTKHNARQRGEQTLDDALSASHTTQSDAVNFEASCIRFHSVCGSDLEADAYIARAEADGKLDTTEVITEAALQHYAKKGFVEKEEHTRQAISRTIERLETSYRGQLEGWRRVRLAFFECHAHCGDVVKFERIRDELYCDKKHMSSSSPTFGPLRRHQEAHLNHLHTLVYKNCRSQADSINAFDFENYDERED